MKTARYFLFLGCAGVMCSSAFAQQQANPNPQAQQQIAPQQVQQLLQQQAAQKGGRNVLPVQRGPGAVPANVPEDLPDFERDENGELDKGKPMIQIALLLDTSGSMSGLIDQAKERLWGIVNEFLEAKRDGEDPIFQVALYEYGKSTLKPKDAWVRQIVPLTVDLDKVSEELFALNTKGGEEYCGWVVGQSLRELGWSENEKDLRVIFVAGNEPFTQGPIDANAVCAEAVRKGIVVNTIHCGGHDQGVAGGWKAGADAGGGAYVSIDHNQVLAHIDAPQDKELKALNDEINGTYVAFGKFGEEGKNRQLAQDSNALASNVTAFYGRASAKSGKYYSNASWDLVDWSKEEGNDIATLKEEDLPEELKKLDAEDRKKFVSDMASKRSELQSRIKTLSSERAKYVAEERKKLVAAGGAKALDDAVIENLKAEATKLGFTLK